MAPKISAIVPIKLKSRRLPNKNFLSLGNQPLSRYIFDQLIKVERISEVFCYSSQPQIMPLYPNEIRYLPRPTWLDGDEVRANELFGYAIQKIDADIIVLCHATGPFIRSSSIEQGLEAVLSGRYRCAFSASKHPTYAWFDGSPLNYEPEKMVQTQNLTPVYLETSGFYIFYREDYLQTNTRINGTPFIVEVDTKEAIDIDEPKDFNLAKALLDFDPFDASFAKDNFFVSLANSRAPHRNIQHICFDFDGVLIDSIQIMRIAWQRVRKDFKLEIEFEKYAERIGLPFDDILDQIGVPKRLHEDVKAAYDCESLKHLDNIALFDGVIESLQRLKKHGIKVTLATSKSIDRTTAILAHHFIKSGFNFDFVATPESVEAGRGKPNPDQLLRAAIAVGADPYNSLYVGDMEVDRQAAERAGFQFIYAKWGYGRLKVNNGIWFRAITDLVDFLIE